MEATEAKTQTGPALLLGNTFKHKDMLKSLGFRWDADRKCWVHGRWDSSRNEKIPKGITVSFIEPEKPLTLEELKEKLAVAKNCANAPIVYSNDRQYARAQDSRAASWKEVSKLEAQIRSLEAKATPAPTPAPEATPAPVAEDKGSVEEIALSFSRFKDKAGNPTCCLDWTDNTKKCPFIATNGAIGQFELCLFPDPLTYKTPLVRRGADGLGTLTPCKNCPLWKNA